MAQLLIVEDERPVRDMLRLLLEDEGFGVVEASDGDEALRLVDQAAPDLVLLDLRLPGMSGLEVCHRLRQSSSVPVIIVTAHVDSHDVVAGLEAGADDYVTKPFVGKELTARIRAALRRTRQASDSAEIYSIADVEIRPRAGLVSKRGEHVHLTKTEFRLLCELAQQAGLVLSRQQLLINVWGYDYLGDSRLVDAHIRRLRIKVEDDPAKPRLIQTVRGLGYRLERTDGFERTA